jgi:hypothetical protein
MARSNTALGYDRIHEISEGVGDVAGTSLTANLQVGKRGDTYRAYCYLWHHEQDASREGIRDSLMARGNTPQEAMSELLRRATDQWTESQARGVRRAIIEVQESLDEDGEL